ncbi:bifunctional pinoresinol-lariciresinol reductase 3 [Selaginella moellendorffii]|uniref:bifunctional pinoresinol-lariciresinol reductase 3 n=1 Tax=Selaginella moellendorffii TaxID=88036 RepID=UPI000D1CDBC1|nr:bifunctional pinoresinol-lariciresinol reductase 3 [Selaginella moellendorffii]|eukprot:XP_024544936.1 bifunctional pinoresinol-lariciresinol reductase 3 [Selaginella moellendorffii]
MEPKSKILIVGATGYIGKYIATASIQSGHPTSILVRPQVSKHVDKVRFLVGLRKAGATIYTCFLEDQEGLVRILQQVDVVICALGEDQLKLQYDLIRAVKEAGNIKKFYPSEFGMDADRICKDQSIPESPMYRDKVAIRRAIEAAGIPHTFFMANCIMGIMLASFVQMDGFPTFTPPRDKVCIYKDGDQKAFDFGGFTDLATYLLKSVDDPRTLNKALYVRPPGNALTMNEQVALWEEMTGVTLEKRWMSEEEILLHINDAQTPLQLREVWTRIYHFFYNGAMCFELAPDDIEATALYPEVEYTSPQVYLKPYVC